MTEITYIGENQTVVSGANVPFNTAIHKECPERWRSGSSSIVLTKAGRYLVTFSANVANPTGGTTDTALNLAITDDGEALAGTLMTTTPTILDAFNNVSVQTYVDVYPCCCETIAVENVGTADLLINNQNLTVVREGAYVR